MLPDKSEIVKDRKRLGFKLETARKDKGWTLEAAGEQLNRGHRWVWDVENAERRIDAVELWYMCKVYELDYRAIVEEAINA